MLSVSYLGQSVLAAVIIVATAVTVQAQEFSHSAAHTGQNCPQCAQMARPLAAPGHSNCGCHGGNPSHECLSCLTWKHFCQLKGWLHGHASHFKSTTIGEAQHIAPPPKYLPVPTRPVFAPSPYLPLPTAQPFGGEGIGASLTRPGYPRR